MIDPNSLVHLALLGAAILLLASAALLVAAGRTYCQARAYLEELRWGQGRKRDSSGRLYRERL